MIYPATAAHIAKHTEQVFHIAVETKAVYNDVTFPYIESIPADKMQWVYNILERYVVDSFRASIFETKC
jgi:m7GpppX diphosphatase